MTLAIIRSADARVPFDDSRFTVDERGQRLTGQHQTGHDDRDQLGDAKVHAAEITGDDYEQTWVRVTAAPPRLRRPPDQNGPPNPARRAAPQGGLGRGVPNKRGSASPPEACRERRPGTTAHDARRLTGSFQVRRFILVWFRAGHAPVRPSGEAWRRCRSRSGVSREPRCRPGTCQPPGRMDEPWPDSAGGSSGAGRQPEGSRMGC